MAMLDTFFDDFKKKLTCLICHDIFTDPKTLPCLHSYCTQCITQWYTRSGDQVEKKMNCPMCNTTIPVPDGDPSKLRSSFYFSSLLQLLHAMKSNANQPGLSDCVSCEESQVLVAFCPQCDGSICEECVKTHKTIKQLRNKHQPAKFVEFKEENVKSFVESKMVCKENSHEEEKLEYFCKEENCRRCVCQKCFALNHQNHQLQSLEEAAEDAKKDIQESINRAEQRKETFEEELKKFKENSERSRQEIELAKKEIRRAEEMICKMVSDHSTAMISELDQTLNEQTAANDQESVKNGIDQLSSFIQQWQEMQDKGVLYDIIESKNDHKAICETLLETRPSFVTVEPAQRDVTARYMTVYQVMQSVTGKILRTVKAMADPLQCTFASLEKVCYSFENDFCIITRNADGEVCPTRIESIDVRIKDVEGNEVEKRVSEEETGVICVSYKVEKTGPYEIQVNIGGEPIKGSPQNVDMLDMKELFKPVKIFGRKGCGRGELNSPQSIAVSDNGEIAIADSLNHRIQIFSHDGTYLRDFGSKGTGGGKLYFPFGVVFSEDKIIVSDGSYDDVKLKEFDLSGAYVRTINRPEEWLVGHGICCLEDRNIAVCCGNGAELCNRPSIKVLTKQGGLIHEFDMPDWEQPRYITYGNGKYFVSSTNKHYVSVFDEKGTFSYRFGEEGERDGQFDGVRGLAVYGTDMILVCDLGNHRVQLFTQEGQFIRSFGSFGPGVGRMNQPTDVVTVDGQVYVLEFESSRVQIWK